MFLNPFQMMRLRARRQREEALEVARRSALHRAAVARRGKAKRGGPR
jgi:hypothetical protein